MEHRPVLHVGGHLPQQLVLERQHLRLLLFAVGGHAFVVQVPELFRRDVVENLTVAR
jgi:hypothetical protein